MEGRSPCTVDDWSERWSVGRVGQIVENGADALSQAGEGMPRPVAARKLHLDGAVVASVMPEHGGVFERMVGVAQRIEIADVGLAAAGAVVRAVVVDVGVEREAFAPVAGAGAVNEREPLALRARVAVRARRSMSRITPVTGSVITRVNAAASSSS